MFEKFLNKVKEIKKDILVTDFEILSFVALVLIFTILYKLECLTIFFVTFLEWIGTLNGNDLKNALIHVIPVLMGLLILIVIKRNFRKGTKVNSFYSRPPISSFGDDKLAREPLVNNMVKRLAESNMPNFTYHLDGKWGDGKTSIINLFLKKIKKDKRFDNYIIVNFNPSTLSAGSNLYDAFFTSILKVAPSLYQYLNSFLEFLNNSSIKMWKIADITIFIRVFIDIFYRPSSLEEVKIGLFKELKNKNKILLIIIDDIDRLFEQKEVFELFKIIREFQHESATNVKFLLSFNRVYTDNFFRTEGSLGNHGDYLSKCISYSSVVTPAKDVVVKYFQNIFEREVKLIKNLKKDDEGDLLYLNFTISNFSKIIHNVRSVHAFLDYFLSMLEQKHYYCDVKQLFKIAYIKVFFIEDFYWIVKHKLELTGNSRNKINFEDIKIDESKQIIKELFPNNTSSWGLNLDINNRERFDLYVRDDDYAYDLDDREVCEFIHNWPFGENQKIEHFFDSRGTLVALETHKTILSESRDQYNDLLKLAEYLASKYPKNYKILTNLFSVIYYMISVITNPQDSRGRDHDSIELEIKSLMSFWENNDLKQSFVIYYANLTGWYGEDKDRIAMDIATTFINGFEDIEMQKLYKTEIEEMTGFNFENLD